MRPSNILQWEAGVAKSLDKPKNPPHGLRRSIVEVRHPLCIV